MPTPDLNLENDAFWSTVAQVSPVLAFALMLEIRRTAKTWTVGQRWARLIQSFFYVAVMFALVNSFAIALDQLISHSASPATLRLVAFVLTVVATFLLFNPLVELTFRANLDWTEALRVLRPGSLWWKLRRKSREVVRESELLVKKAEANLARADRSYLHGRREYKLMKNSPDSQRLSTDSEWCNDGPNDEVNAARRRFLAIYATKDGEPLIEAYRRSRDERRSAMVRAKKHLKQAKKNLVLARDIRDESRLFAVVGVSDDIFAEEITAAHSRLDELTANG